MTKPLRESMPEVAAFIDEMREAFGAAEINASIKAGMAGQRTFYARENGLEVGTPMDEPGCASCAAWRRPGASSGYCGGDRPDLPQAYGPGNPLRRLPADRGATCKAWRLEC